MIDLNRHTLPLYKRLDEQNNIKIMKTKLPNQYSNLVEYNYEFKLTEGLYFTLNAKMIKMNCKNYSITSKDEITIQATNEFSILTIRTSRNMGAQYLITKKIKTIEMDKIPERYLPEDFKEYIRLSARSIEDYDILEANQANACYHPKI